MCALSGETFNTVRLRFSKTGRARYISHLDLNRTMTRALRRAHIPLWYTEGFNRHPYITFAAPLSLGVESDSERMDLRLTEPMEASELCARLNAVMPEGLRFTGAAPAVCKAGDLGFARYRIALSLSPETVRAFLEQPSIPVQKTGKKGVVRELDLKASLEDTVLTPTGEGCALEVTLPCSSAATVNPSLLCEALRAFAGEESLLPRVRRLELYDGEHRVFL